MLMHASLTASTLILTPLALAGVAFLTVTFVLAAALWVVVGAVAVANGGHLSRQPLREAGGLVVRTPRRKKVHENGGAAV